MCFTDNHENSHASIGDCVAQLDHKTFYLIVGLNYNCCNQKKEFVVGKGPSF